MNKIVRIQPMQYIHLLDLNTNVTVLVVGPESLILQDNHQLVEGPLPFVVIPPGHYCVIENPVKQPCEPGKPCDLKHGFREMRFFKEPFPLYPGEAIEGTSNLSGYKTGIKPLPVIRPNEGLQLYAIMAHLDGDEERKTGDLWQLEGPLTYMPTPYAEIVKMVKPHIIKHGQAIKLRAKQDLVDKKGKKRVTSEEWLIRELGAYLPGVYEEVVGIERAHTLTEDKALQMRAKQTCVDALGKKRNAGDEWLVTSEDTELYIPEVSEEVVAEVSRTVVSRQEYCIITDPIDSKGRNQLGKRELRKGVTSFFLHPGEDLEGGILKSYILEKDEALVLSAVDHFDDNSLKKKCHRSPGDRWMIIGPTEYIPSIEVTVNSRRKAIPLSENEGVYVRDIQSGAVRAVMGPQSYLFNAYEKLWEKELSEDVENILKNGGGIGSADIRKMAYFESSIDPTISNNEGRDKTRVIVYRCPGNTAVQVYDYLRKAARVIFGPDLVVLGPHENFNVLSLSAGKPKKPNTLKTICLMLGPDFITDIIEVETSDHARLKIMIAMNNLFEVERGNDESEQAIFSVPDYIGNACKTVASRIRGKVAQVPFDEFHRYSTSVIKKAVFGVDKDGKIKQRLRFDANQLVVTNIDIRSIEPVDLHMSESLSKSVQMAIEISTKSIERAAEHEAKRTEQMAKGLLERQKLTNEKEAENARVNLFELRAITAAVESSGQKKAEVYARVAREVRLCCGRPVKDGFNELHTWRKALRPPKPLAPPLLEMEMMMPRKLRVLALTGGHSCTEVLKYQSAPLRQAIGRDLCEFTFIEGTEDWNWFEGEPIVSDMEKKLAKGAQLKNWYMDTITEETPTDKPNREKQFDPKSRVEYHKIPEKVQKLKELIFDEGPFDVLVAFSQGCIMTHLLIGHLRKEEPAMQAASKRWHFTRNQPEEMPWRVSVFFNGMHIRDKDYMDLFDTPSPHPTVHVFGKADEFYDYGRDGFGYRPQEEYYVDPVIFSHSEGHAFPTQPPRAREIYDRVAAEIWRHCGGRPPA